MLKRGTVLLLMSAIALGGGVLLLENFGSNGAGNQSSTTTGLNTLSEGEGEPLLPFPEEDIDSVVVTRLNDTLTFNKSDEGTWQMTQPETGLAEGGAIAFLLSQLTGATVQSLTVESADSLFDFGLADPSATVAVTAGEQSYQIAVGGGDFSGDKRYVRLVNADDEEDADQAATAPIKIHVVAGGIVNAVERPTSEWLMPVDDPAASDSSSEPNSDAGDDAAGNSDANDGASDQSSNNPTTDVGGE